MPLSLYSQNDANDNEVGKYTKIVLQLRADKKLQDAATALKDMPRRDVVSDLIASAGKYASIGGLEGAPFVPLINTAQNLDANLFKEEFLKSAKKLIVEKKYEALLKCGYLYMHDLKFAELSLGDELLTDLIGLTHERMQESLSLINSKHTYRIYIVEEIRRLSLLEENNHYIFILEGIREHYLNSDEFDERTAEEVVDKCNRALAHVRKLKG
jgi:hypothetical protein